jgi:hypothetical protein
MIASRRHRRVQRTGLLQIVRLLNSRMRHRLCHQLNKSRMILQVKRRTLLLYHQARLAQKPPLQRAPLRRDP